MEEQIPRSGPAGQQHWLSRQAWAPVLSLPQGAPRPRQRGETPEGPVETPEEVSGKMGSEHPSVLVTSLFCSDPCALVSGFLSGGTGEPTGDPQQTAPALSVPHGAVCCPDR